MQNVPIDNLQVGLTPRNVLDGVLDFFVKKYQGKVVELKTPWRANLTGPYYNYELDHMVYDKISIFTIKKMKWIGSVGEIAENNRNSEHRGDIAFCPWNNFQSYAHIRKSILSKQERAIGDFFYNTALTATNFGFKSVSGGMFGDAVYEYFDSKTQKKFITQKIGEMTLFSQDTISELAKIIEPFLVYHISGSIYVCTDK